MDFENMATERCAILSDIHANARAFRSALEIARSVGYDRLIILGDLLSYGCDIRETLDLVHLEINNGAYLVEGNHDRMYLDLLSGDSKYYNSLPDWLRESVDFTLEELDPDSFFSLPWQEELGLGNALLAHANPFGFGDWTYLNTSEQRNRARDTLMNRGFQIGVFGHTHRAYVDPPGVFPWLANPGSIGQPRGTGAASLLLLDLGASAPESNLINVPYDVAGQKGALWDSSMSEPTRVRLCSYFDQVPHQNI